MENPDPLGPWLSLSEVARTKGVSVAAVWKQLQRLLRDGKIEVRPGRGRERLIHLPTYDRAVGEVTDLARQRGADMARGLPLDDEPMGAPGVPATGAGARATFTEAQRQSAVYQAGLRSLEYNERLGQLLPIGGEAGMARAATLAGEALTAAIARIPLRAGDLVAVASADGEVGVRRLLKTIGNDLLTTFAKSLREVAASANDAGGGFAIDLPEPAQEDEA